jgi:hypothetical protein
MGGLCETRQSDGENDDGKPLLSATDVTDHRTPARKQTYQQGRRNEGRPFQAAARGGGAADEGSGGLASPVPEASKPLLASIVSCEISYVCNLALAIAASKLRCIACAINSPPVCCLCGEGVRGVSSQQPSLFQRKRIEIHRRRVKQKEMVEDGCLRFGGRPCSDPG